MESLVLHGNPTLTQQGAHSPWHANCVCVMLWVEKQPADMDFSGTWKVYSEENLDEFLKIIGAPEIVVKMRKDVKPVIVIEQKGKDFTYTMKTPFFSRVNSFTIGKESEISSVDGRKLKCTVREENGKLICETDRFTCVREIQGDEMIETATAGSVTFISRSKRA